MSRQPIVQAFRPNLLAILILIAIASPALAQAPECTAPLKPMLQAELLFGGNVGGRYGVGNRAWARFLAREVTPRFPDGLTVYDVRGQWRDGARLVRERSRVVMIVMPAEPSPQPRIAAIVEAYKQAFRQKSVGVVVKPVCAGF